MSQRAVLDDDRHIDGGKRDNHLPAELFCARHIGERVEGRTYISAPQTQRIELRLRELLRHRSGFGALPGHSGVE